MIPYFLLLFGSAIIPLLVYRPRKNIYIHDFGVIARKRNFLTVTLFFSGLLILLCLRDLTVGIDLLYYKSFFEICCNTPFTELSSLKWEIGYTVYNKLVSLISTDYRFYLIVTAVITVLPIYFFYARQKRFSYLLVVLFLNMPCFLMMFSGLRQAIATSLGLLAYWAIEEKKHVLGALLILLAASFHISALILVLIFPLLYLKIKSKHLLFIVPIMVAIYIFRTPIFTLLLRFMPSKYIEHYGEIQQTGAFGMMLLFIVFTVFSFVILDETVMTNRDYFLRNILLAATIIQFFVPIHGLIQRASYYFLIFVPVSIVGIVQAPKRKLKNISDVAVIVMGCFFTVYFFFNAIFTTDNLLDVFPYKFFWSEQIW